MGHPLRLGFRHAFSRFEKNLVKPLEGRFLGQLADSIAEIKLANVAVLPYAG
jgi:hypothetical protein